MKRLLAILLALMLVLAGFTAAEAAEPDESRGIVVLYTNDVHCGVDDNIGYAGVAAYKNAYEKAGYEVVLVDSGDAVQGATIGTLSKGDTSLRS